MFRGASGDDGLKHLSFEISGFKDGLARILEILIIVYKAHQDKF